MQDSSYTRNPIIILTRDSKLEYIAAILMLLNASTHYTDSSIITSRLENAMIMQGKLRFGRTADLGWGGSRSVPRKGRPAKPCQSVEISSQSRAEIAVKAQPAESDHHLTSSWD